MLVCQTSPDKSNNFPCTIYRIHVGPLGFTILDPKRYAGPALLARPRTRPSMVFLFVSSQFCDPASFRPPLTGWPLPFASDYRLITSLSDMDGDPPTGDFHPISYCPCRAYTNQSWPTQQASALKNRPQTLAVRQIGGGVCFLWILKPNTQKKAH